MISLNLPSYKINVAERCGRRMIYDFLRRRYVALTPEEWVRQHFTHFLVEHRHYPAALLGNEITVQLNGVARRCDSVLYSRDGGRPRMIVEYKAPEVPVTQAVFTQISAYNSVLRADYLVVSNGLAHYCCRMDYEQNKAEFLPEIPFYEDL